MGLLGAFILLRKPFSEPIYVVISTIFHRCKLICIIWLANVIFIDSIYAFFLIVQTVLLTDNEKGKRKVKCSAPVIFRSALWHNCLITFSHLKLNYKWVACSLLHLMVAETHATLQYLLFWKNMLPFFTGTSLSFHFLWYCHISHDILFFLVFILIWIFFF